MLKKILIKLGLLAVLLALCFPFTFVFGWVYRFFYDPYSNELFLDILGGSFWGPSVGIIVGFLMSLMFFASLYLILSFKRVVAIILLIILNILMLAVFWGVWLEDLYILIGSSVCGYLLGELLLLAYRKLKK